MASRNHEVWSAAFLALLLSSFQGFAHGAPQVPCYFIFGDSLSDAGNNNGLSTLAKANFTPYGIDFPAGPTGRFSNGRTIVDVITQLLGFDHFIPPAVSAESKDLLKGVNYASAAAGIRDETGQELGARICLNIQMRNFLFSFFQISKTLGSDGAARQHLNQCLFTVGIGSNDYINNYFVPNVYQTSRQYTPDKYAAALIDQYTQHLKDLYTYGARKVAVFGLGPAGCAPAELAQYGANSDTGCVDKVNDAVQIFNNYLMALVDNLNKQFNDAKFTFINVGAIGDLDPAATGFKVKNSGCCGGQTGCFPQTTPCKNRADYAFWDEFHPTDGLNVILGGRAYKATNPNYVHPFDIQTLIQS